MITDLAKMRKGQVKAQENRNSWELPPHSIRQIILKQGRKKQTNKNIPHYHQGKRGKQRGKNVYMSVLHGFKKS